MRAEVRGEAWRRVRGVRQEAAVGKEQGAGCCLTGRAVWEQVMLLAGL